MPLLRLLLTIAGPRSDNCIYVRASVTVQCCMTHPARVVCRISPITVCAYNVQHRSVVTRYYKLSTDNY